VAANGSTQFLAAEVARALLRRAGLGSRWPAGMAAWRSATVAVVVGLVILAVGPSVHASTPGPDWHLGYSDAGDHQAHAAALELEAAPVPDPAHAPLLRLQLRPPLLGVPARTPGRAPVATRDRSPPTGQAPR
jgi:hypothetical protein